MNKRLSYLLVLATVSISMAAQTTWHVSATKGNNSNDGSEAQPLQSINAAAQRAMPGDFITVHEGIYREKVVPPRGGISDKQRITYQAAEGEKVIITGSEPVKGWTRVNDHTWKVTLPNSFFGTRNPFDEQLYGSWYHGHGRPNHTGFVIHGDLCLRETFSLAEVMAPIDGVPRFYAEADGNGGPVLMNLEWVRPSCGEKKTSMQASVKGGDQSICIAIVDRWPFGYLRDGSQIFFEDVDFGNGSDTLFVQAATLAKAGIIEACIDDPSGTPVSAYITNTGDWERFGVFPIVLHNRLHGRHHVYLTVKAPTPKMDGQTTIYAQFAKGVDPNKEQVEVTVRPEVFYPDHTGVDYITVRGFTLQHAATNWAPPSAEQPGLIGPHWAKGWIIEHNTICRSRCSGISLGRSTYGHAHHYQYLPPRIYADPEGGQTVEQLRDYFENASWDKDEAGHHIVRHNHIYDCGQTGIVGCSGGAFSLIEDNEMHDICMGETFTGEEMGGIKLHFANDALIRGNHIYRCIRGLWLDWGGQGMQVTDNLFHDNNEQEDIFIEVCHGPILVANNILLSRQALTLSQGIACVHNLIGGKVMAGRDRCAGGRYTYYYPAHSTKSLGKAPNLGGDLQWHNNLLLPVAKLEGWDEPEHPIDLVANTTMPEGTTATLEERTDGWYLSLNANCWQDQTKHKLVTTATLRKPVVTKQAFTNPDGSPIKLNTDYLGIRRKVSNPSAGPFERKSQDANTWKVWNKKTRE